MRTKAKILPALLAALSLFLSGCAAWTNAGGLYEDSRMGFSAELPEGWLMSDSNGALFLTREGPSLQYISIQTQALGSPLIFSRKTFYPGMKTVDMAEVFLENNSLDPRMGEFRLLELSLGKVAGHPGFRASGSFRDHDGLRHRFAYYGFMTGGLYYGIGYSAAERVYFKRHLATFEQLVSTFKVLED